jgi:hypothetical protein
VLSITTRSSLTPVLLGALLLSACGDKADSPELSDSSTPDSSMAAPVNTRDYISREELRGLKGQSCNLLPISAVVPVANKPETEIQNFAIMGCQYSWEKDKADEIRAKNQDLVSEGLAKGISIIDIGRQQAATENTVSLYLDTYFTSTDTSRLDAHFRAITHQLTAEEKAHSRAAMEKVFSPKNAAQETAPNLSEQHREIASGMLAAIQQEVEQEVFVTVDGVGNRAAWSDYSNRLVVQHRNLFFTLNVALNDDKENLAAAKSLAAVVIANLENLL